MLPAGDLVNEEERKRREEQGEHRAGKRRTRVCKNALVLPSIK
jgi:hypothetical protein